MSKFSLVEFSSTFLKLKMLKRIIQNNSVSICSLKVLYYCVKLLGMVFFTISDRGVLKFCKKSWIFSISFWSICTFGYICVLSYNNRDLFQTNFIRRMTFAQFSIKVVFTFAIFKLIARQHKQFIEAANRTMQTFIRITILTKNLRVLGREFYLIVLGRIFLFVLMLISDWPNLMNVSKSKDLPFVVQNILGYGLGFTNYYALNVICLVYISSSAMFHSIGLHIVKLVERIQKFEIKSVTVFRRRQMMQEFCLELDECSEIYSEIFKTTTQFHTMVQLILFLNFSFTVISLMYGIHVCFVHYLKFGEILWFLLILATLQLLNLCILVLCADLMVRRSNVPHSLDWESLYLKHDEQLDRCVYQFLTRLSVEELKIDIYGLFTLNRELCLQVFSMMVGYLTIVIQFSMMGYFKEEN
ncbi:gustatory receptor for bitter taste 93a-like [Episyrphus balteatus]|uniref:gustatory receptor for bitter taste 93a-like n=1 Tax=Episyrphus balteatus TaxID=286459 RepID=UPI002486A93E|nr:gustatory receptor for bitter taste 93a-like [Episyrphus balteatus]